MPRSKPSKSKAAKPFPNNRRTESPELGSGDLQTKYNARTGRPIRDGAGRRKSSVPDYVDTIQVIEDDSPPSESGSEDDEGVKKKPPKRKRTPSPPLPDIASPPLFPEDVPSREPTPLPANMDDGQSINLTFHVPPGFTGPFIVKLDQSMLLKEPDPKRLRRSATDNSSIRSNKEDTIKVRPKLQTLAELARRDPKKLCFLDLAAELRNKVYRLLFVTQESVDFGHPNNFSRSSAFLRTCKTIYREGKSVLYSDNKFVFSRNGHSRAPYWSSKAKEIGYQDLRVFLNSIGPTNISLLRTVSIAFTDATPSAAPLLSHEDRRFVRDEHAIYCLRQLSKYSKLKEIEVQFYGRKILYRTDYRFLDALQGIKADIVKVERSNRYWSPTKVDPQVRDLLVDAMQRSPKLYDHESDD